MQPTDQNAHQQPGQHGAPPGPFRRGWLHQLDGDRGADAAGVPDREIDLAEEDDEELPHCRNMKHGPCWERLTRFPAEKEEGMGPDRWENEGNEDQGGVDGKTPL